MRHHQSWHQHQHHRHWQRSVKEMESHRQRRRVSRSHSTRLRSHQVHQSYYCLSVSSWGPSTMNWLSVANVLRWVSVDIVVPTSYVMVEVLIRYVDVWVDGDEGDRTRRWRKKKRNRHRQARTMKIVGVAAVAIHSPVSYDRDVIVWGTWHTHSVCV